jgi:hypothetical protein
MSEPAKDEAELVEQIARGIMCARPNGGCLVTDWQREERQNPAIERVLSDARAALAAIRAAGWAVVPVEPTEEMFDAGHASSAHGHGIVALYRAMLAAAPGVKP